MITRSLHTSSKLCLVASILVSLIAGLEASAQTADPPIPRLAQWETRMQQYGQQYCQSGVWDFDAERVFYQIKKYTGDPTSWSICAGVAEAAYRDGYVLTTNDTISGVSVFSLGLRMDYDNSIGNDGERQKDSDAIAKLALDSQYGKNGADVTGLDYSHAVAIAQTLMAYVDYLDLTKTPADAKYASLVDQSLNIIDQWFVLKYWMEDGALPYAPWQAGMTMQALIRAHSYKSDKRIPDKIRVALDWLWTNAWRTSVAGSGFYMDSQNPFVAEPLHNLLMTSAYAWYYKQTNDVTYRDRADEIFDNGVQYASLSLPAEFNENYMWSFDYVAMRQPPAPPTTPPSTTPPPTTTPSANKAPICDKFWVNPSILWPPNNKMVAVDIGGITDEDGDAISLTYGKPVQNESVKGLEAGDTGPDAEFATQLVGKWYLKAQRSGSGQGREYLIPFTAEDGKGGSCTGTARVTVPHDKGKPVPPSTQRFDSTER
jgi:hypothetical protein